MLGELANRTNVIAGGSASGQDKKLIGLIESAQRHLKVAARSFEDARQLAARAAAEDLERARQQRRGRG